MSDNWKSLDPFAQSSIVALFSIFDLKQLYLKDYIIESLIDFSTKSQEQIDYEYFINQNPKSSTGSQSSEFYHDYPLALYLCSRINFDTIDAEKIVKDIFKRLYSDPNQLSTIFNQNLSDNILDTYRLDKNNIIYASLFKILNDNQPLNKKLYSLDSNFIKDTEYYFDSYIESILIDFDIEQETVPKTHAIDNENFSNHSYLNEYMQNHAYPLFIDSYEDGLPVYQRSQLIDSLLQFEAIFGYLNWQNNLYINNNTNSINTNESTDNHAARLLFSDDKYINYLTDLCEKLGIKINQLTIAELILSKDFCLCRDICKAKIKDRADNHNPDLFETLLEIHSLGLLTYHFYDKIIDSEYPINTLGSYSKLKRVLINKIVNFDQKFSTKNQSLFNIYNSTMSETDDFYASIKSSYKYDIHYQKSIGSSIVPVYLFQNIHPQLMNFFKHYISARQILDDLKDFEQDTSADPALPKKITTINSFMTENQLIDIDKIFQTLEKQINEMTVYANQINNQNEYSLAEILKQYSEALNKQITKCRLELYVLRELRLLTT